MSSTDDIAAGESQSGYCRSCGYFLCGLSAGKCPECGHSFDPADESTLRTQPPRLILRRWTKRGVVLLVLFSSAIFSVALYSWWTWHAEQQVIERLRKDGADVRIRRIASNRLMAILPERLMFLNDHAYYVELHRESAISNGQLDLGVLSHLTDLDLAGCNITDKCIAQLRQMQDLQCLILSDNPIDGSGIRGLIGCRQLKILDLTKTKLDDEGLQQISKLKSLVSLYVDETCVTDNGLIRLSELESLMNLGLSYTAITDAGMPRLQNLIALRALSVDGTKVTSHGAASLYKICPNLKIFR